MAHFTLISLPRLCPSAGCESRPLSLPWRGQPEGGGSSQVPPLHPSIPPTIPPAHLPPLAPGVNDSSSNTKRRGDFYPPQNKACKHVQLEWGLFCYKAALALHQREIISINPLRNGRLNSGSFLFFPPSSPDGLIYREASERRVPSNDKAGWRGASACAPCGRRWS